MSEYIDVMALLPDQSPYFVVNTTPGVLSVDIRTPTHSPVYDYLLRAAGGKKTFRAGDNFIVVSAGFVFPESFGLAGGASNLVQNNPSIAVGAQASTGGSVYFLPNFGNTGVVMPIDNYELPLNIFVDISGLDIGGGVYPFRTQNFNLYGAFRGLDQFNSIYPKVSMVGVPTSLHGTTQHLTVFVKIVHTFPLI
jgi:hypothetical protein